MTPPPLFSLLVRWFRTTEVLPAGAEQEDHRLCHRPGQAVAVGQSGVPGVRRAGEHGTVSPVAAGGFFWFSRLRKRPRVHLHLPFPTGWSSAGPRWNFLSQVTLCAKNKGPSHWTSSAKGTWPSPHTSPSRSAGRFRLKPVERRPSNLHPGSWPQAEEVTATAGRDYLLSPSSLVQFDPGWCSRRRSQEQSRRVKTLHLLRGVTEELANPDSPGRTGGGCGDV